MHLMLTANEDSAEKGSSKLTDEQINGRYQIFLFARYETSSNTLAYIMTYQLALNQNVKDKLRKEINEAVKRKPESSLYDLSHDIDYLDCVINESLRLNPPLAQVNCECVDDNKFNDIYIPAGQQVIIPVYFLHRDPDVWPDQEDPERFQSPAKTGHSSPISVFAIRFRPKVLHWNEIRSVEIKIALEEFLMKYKFVRLPETQVPLKILAGVTLILKSRENRKGLELFASAFLFYFCVWCVFLRLISCYDQFSKLWDLMLVADILDPGKDILEEILKLESPVCEKKEENYLSSSKFKTKVQLSINLRRMIRLINLQNVSINFAMNF